MVREPGVRSVSRPGPDTKAVVVSVEDGIVRPKSDRLATEEPLEIRLNSSGQVSPLAVTMRTPGNDFELVAGFLFSEGIVTSSDQLSRRAYCVDEYVDEQLYNVITVELGAEATPPTEQLHRHFYTTSSCGVCGKASLEALQLRGVERPGPGPVLTPDVVYSLPESLGEHQGIFATTGGLHAAALFDGTGELLSVREDVGRHNALDKLIGWAFMEGMLPLDDHLVMVSGRSSFEIVQKSLVAGIPVVCAVSAPSSLAVSVAQEFGMTLIGFLRGRRFNVYTGARRLGPAAGGPPPASKT